MFGDVEKYFAASEFETFRNTKKAVPTGWATV